MKDRLLRLLFPPKCVFCRRLLARSETDICGSCLDGISLAGPGHAREQGSFYKKAFFPLWYEDEVRDALLRFKFSGRQNYARPFARLLAFALEGQLEEYDIIAPVPTNPRRVFQRGYDHALLLARELAPLEGKPMVRALARVRETKPMHGLKPAERRANVLGAFDLAVPAADIGGKTILLVDDILTTGATASECAGVLLEFGAAAVYLVAVAASRDKSVNAS